MKQESGEAKAFRIEIDASGATAGLTAECLGAEVAAAHGPRDERALTLAAYDDNGAWLGGIIGLFHWRWLYIRHVYVAPDWRGRGIGAALLAQAEDWARKQQAVGLYLDTFEASAEAFYRRGGFMLVGRIVHFPPGGSRAFLQKPLA
jgi:GNAT superfamily N-acetyltransferase